MGKALLAKGAAPTRAPDEGRGQEQANQGVLELLKELAPQRLVFVLLDFVKPKLAAPRLYL
jgi:hypothetical protein